ncbi:flavin monoamine oxidase family protein [Pseudomonas rubra]|uniref:Tryptophan 2-monooxygenase n=1 Tax=Pseudomonas rubra TaxID=2942627 RepID=A0ABT5P1W7_9PSED|nr:NAD(P)/FAD-dependent oxidoreductase [Pseudomonas rubra]MDD1012266.1 FAD-dependent oxidoreductase [Pseudomonas rubra]MDD1037387.1 FAD-dependent oxidoreductase [Pseudomonas rubra]MDD1153104.1 FAD-dependent oxidoreductase [Pseudomonas rubra]
MSAIPSRILSAQRVLDNQVRALIPDFPFDYGQYLMDKGQAPLGRIQPQYHGRQVLVVGAGVAGLVAAYEAMRMGLHPVVVEASGRIGGRLFSSPVDADVPFERGAMRFPLSGRALMHYFSKVGMLENSEDFPNPGSAAAVSTVVDYGDEKFYYEVGNSNFPRPPAFENIEIKFFEEFLEQAPIHFQEMEQAMSAGTIDQAKIKRLWNAILAEGWDNLSFHAAMVEQARWSDEDINLFGQIGFGTGGWNTDFPNCFLEVLRVLYTGLDINHLLMRDGADQLPQRLWERSAAAFGDESVFWPQDMTLKELSQAFPGNPLRQEVRQIRRLGVDEGGGFEVLLHDLEHGHDQRLRYDSVVYTPHVRVLDKFRYMNGAEGLEASRSLLTQPQWEAVMYTHYMQSAKVFAATREPFWTARGEDGKQLMSITLSDRLTRGTYLVDYSRSTGDYKGSGIFLSYTWNDDSLKFLGDRQGRLPQHGELCTALLDQVYPGLDLTSHFAEADPFVEINWEDEPFYLGAFKMNLPGQYEYQRLLFSQFKEGSDRTAVDGFILAGDDVSWTGGWAEGAVTTALNAVDKLATRFNNGFSPQGGPISQWEPLKPMTLNQGGPRQQPGVLCRLMRWLQSRLCRPLKR